MSKQNSRLETIYNNKKAMMVLSLILNVVLIAFIVWLSRYAKIKGDLFAQIIAFAVVIGLAMNAVFLMAYGKDSKVFRQIFLGVTSLMFVIFIVGGIYIVRTELSLKSLVNQQGDETVQYSVIGFAEEYTEATMGSHSIGYLSQSDEFETLFKDKVREHSRTVQYVEYKNYNDLLVASLNGDIQYALVPANYIRLADDFAGEDVKPFDKAHVLFGFSTVVDDDYNDVNVTTEPFSILLLGNNENLSDSIILATVNPKTLRVTMTSLARDSYVPIACNTNQSRDKLNHSRPRGRQCIVDTIENFLDVEIDFYFETDFYALEKIIDASGGLELESPFTFAGSFPIEGSPNEYIGVTVPEGLHLLNGKQAVTFARQRHDMVGEDFGRQLNQQYVIREIATKLINERNPERLVSVLEGASKNLQMNISVNDLTALLGYAINQTSQSALDPLSTFRVIQTQVTGTTPMINGMSVVLPYESDVANAKQVIDDNLSTTYKLNDEREFTFSIKKPFELAKRAQGDGSTIDPGEEVDPEPEEKPTKPETSTQFEVPSFTSGNYSKDEVVSWGQRNGVSISFRTIDSTSPDYNEHYADGQMIYQTVDAGMYKDKPNAISITIVSKKAVEVPVEPPVEPEKPEPEEPVVPPVEKPDPGEEKPPTEEGKPETGGTTPTPPVKP